MKTWLIIDCDYLCHRAFHAIGPLSHKSNPTGVLYGFFRDLIILRRSFNTDNFVFCFDEGESLRKKVYPKYKSNRGAKVGKDWEDFRYQITQLKGVLLSLVGYKLRQNLFYQEGFEADDLIAAAWNCLRETRERDDIIVVSGDEDFYQLLDARTKVYHPGRKPPNDYMTSGRFRDLFGIAPESWPVVKSIAGCGTDCIDGVEGVGEKTAARYLRGELPAESANFGKIELANRMTTDNERLIRLPFEGTMTILQIPKGKFNDDAFKTILKELGMVSLLREGLQQRGWRGKGLNPSRTFGL